MTLKEMAVEFRNALIKAIDLCKNNDSEILRTYLAIGTQILPDESILELGETLLKLHNEHLQKEYGDMN